VVKITIFYLDYENGDDANSGADWANAWQTMKYGATAARIAAGDVMRIAKSPDPTSLGINGTWTDGGLTLTLASALNSEIEPCEAIWTAGTNCTTSRHASYEKMGTYACSVTTNASVTGAQKLCYAATTNSDYSGYQQISLWIIRPSKDMADGLITVNLCSDTTGDTVVDTITLPYLELNYSHNLTIDTGGALGGSIQSVAIYCTGNCASTTFYFDNIVASKDSSSADSLTLSSLIGKNDGKWYPIKYIDGTTVAIDNGNNTYGSTVGRGAYTASETVTTWKREAIRVTGTQAAGTQYHFELTDNGSSGSEIEYQGGWNTSTTVQDGETWWDNYSGSRYGLRMVNKQWNKINKLSFVRGYQGVNLGTNSNNCTISNASFIGHVNSGIYTVYSTGHTTNFDTVYSMNNTADGWNCNGLLNVTITDMYLENNADDGLEFAGVASNRGNTITNLSCCNNGDYGLYSYHIINNKFNNVTIEDNGDYGWYMHYSCDNEIDTITVQNNTTFDVYSLVCTRNKWIDYTSAKTSGTASSGFTSAYEDNTHIYGGSTSGHTQSIYSNRGTVHVYDFTMGEASETSGHTASSKASVVSINHDGTTDNHKIFYSYATVSSEASVRHTASGIAWKVSPTSSTYWKENTPVEFQIAEVVCIANTAVTVKAWFRRDNTGLSMSLIAKSDQLTGMTTDYSDSITAAVDTWEELSITFTPTDTGVVKIYAQAYGGTTYNGYVDDVSITGGYSDSVTTMDVAFLENGPFVVNDMGGAAPAAVTTSHGWS